MQECHFQVNFIRNSNMILETLSDKYVGLQY